MKAASALMRCGIRVMEDGTFVVQRGHRLVREGIRLIQEGVRVMQGEISLLLSACFAMHNGILVIGPGISARQSQCFQR